MPGVHAILSIGTASANSAKFREIRPRMYIEDLHYLDTTGDNVTLTLYNVTLTSKKVSYTITSSIPAKQTVINEVYVFSIKYRFSDILLKNT